VHWAFVFDPELLGSLPRHDRRVEFIWDSIIELRAALQRFGGGRIVLRGRMRDEVPRLATALRVQAVHTNHDYEPGAAERDPAVECGLMNHGIGLRTFSHQVVFEKDEVLTRDSRPISVFTAIGTPAFSDSRLPARSPDAMRSLISGSLTPVTQSDKFDPERESSYDSTCQS